MKILYADLLMSFQVQKKVHYGKMQKNSFHKTLKPLFNLDQVILLDSTKMIFYKS